MMSFMQQNNGQFVILTAVLGGLLILRPCGA